ncbi:MAG: hypothetical protein Pg6C_13320 [Treponemataceae bacterium]|nr:MAG: hypothetical protein Pg6C_13320 [Treponemataceae bacterium]
MKKTSKTAAVLSAAAVAALALFAGAIVSCVPNADAAGLENSAPPAISGPGVAIDLAAFQPSASQSAGGQSRSLTADQITASVNYYELAVRKVAAPAGSWVYRKASSPRGGTLAVAVDSGCQYDVLVLAGYKPGAGDPILMRSGFARTPVIGNTVHTQPVSLKNVNIDASLYEIKLKDEASPAVYPNTSKPYRTAAGVMELDLPKWRALAAPDHWLTDGAVKVTAKGLDALIKAYNVSIGGAADAAFPAGGVFPFADGANPGFFDEVLKPHLSLTALLEGQTDNQYPLNTPWGVDMEQAKKLPGSQPDGVAVLEWEVQAHADDVWTAYDTDGKLYWDAYYYAFSAGGAVTGAKFDRWKVQNGLDTAVDIRDGGAGNTGGAVYVKIGSGGGAQFSTGNIVVGFTAPAPRTWTLANLQSTPAGKFAAIVYGGGRFIAGGGSGTWTAYSAGDDVAQQWATDNQTGGSISGDITSIAYNGAGVFVAGLNTGGKIVRSADGGATWTLLDQTDTKLKNAAVITAYGNGVFVAGGSGSGSEGNISRSVDGGATWTLVKGTDISGTDDKVEVFVYGGGGKWVAGGATNNNEGRLWYSLDDAATWLPITVPAPFGTIMSVAYGAGRFVVLDQFNRIKWLNKDDLTQSTPTLYTASLYPAVLTSAVYKVIYARGKFIAVGGGGIAWSYEGDEWYTAKDSSGADIADNSTFSFRTVAYADGIYVAGGENGKILYSVDGKTWAEVSNSPFGTSTIYSLAYTDGLWVAGGNNGKIAWSALD